MPPQLSHADLATLMTTAERIADEVDKILLQGFGRVTALQKADGALVTQIDHAADQYIDQQLSTAYPDHAALSEERYTTYRPDSVDAQHFLMHCTRTQRHYALNSPLKARIMGSAAYHLCWQQRIHRLCVKWRQTLSSTNIDYANKTMIYRLFGSSEQAIGYVAQDGTVYKLRWEEGVRVGRISPDNRVFRDTRYDERELGSFTPEGTIHSHGLFEGGELGWVDPDGTVIQAGLILGEEEIGRVEGEAKAAAGAALLLLFYVDEQEETRRSNR